MGCAGKLGSTSNRCLVAAESFLQVNKIDAAAEETLRSGTSILRNAIPYVNKNETSSVSCGQTCPDGNASLLLLTARGLRSRSRFGRSRPLQLSRIAAGLVQQLLRSATDT